MFKTLRTLVSGGLTDPVFESAVGDYREAPDRAWGVSAQGDDKIPPEADTAEQSRKCTYARIQEVRVNSRSDDDHEWVYVKVAGDHRRGRSAFSQVRRKLMHGYTGKENIDDMVGHMVPVRECKVGQRWGRPLLSAQMRYELGELSAADLRDKGGGTSFFR